MSNQYYIYIITNASKTVLYIGMTNDIVRRLQEHYDNRGQMKTFAGRYNCYTLVFYEICESPSLAIQREKELKKWSRKKKEALIETQNPKWHSLNRNVGFFPK